MLRFLYILLCFLLCAAGHTSGQEYGVDNISKYYFYGGTLYIPYGQKVIYQDNTQWKIIDADSASFFTVYDDNDNIFGIDKNGVYINGKLVETDTTGFTVFSYRRYARDTLFWKTNQAVYLNDSILNDFDASSFSSVSYHGDYFKDKNGVYYRFAKMEDADIATFRFDHINDCYHDTTYIYEEGKKVQIDGEYPELINYSLAKTKNQVCKKEYQKYTIPCKHMDAKTLRPLSRYLSIDKKNVYYFDKIIAPAPADASKIRCYDWINRSFIVIGNKLFNGDDPIKCADIDIQTFGLLPGIDDILYDKKGAFRIEYKSTTNSYERINYPFNYTYPFDIKDIYLTKGHILIYKNQEFYNLTGTSLLDGNMIENLTEEQKEALRKGAFLNYKDYDKGIFNTIVRSMSLSGIDLESFEWVDTELFKWIGNRRFKDKNGVYSIERDMYVKLRDADKDTFEGSIGNIREMGYFYFARDKNHLFLGNRKVDKVSPQNIQLIAIFMGYCRASEFDSKADYNYYLFSNDDGYWLISPYTVEYLGREFPKEILSKDQSNKRTLMYR